MTELNLLSLAIGLWVEGGGHAAADLEAFAESSPEVRGKLGAMVGCDGLW